ncbi:MAG: hypothetical protein QM687_06245 [Ferruginibacter sp.]
MKKRMLFFAVWVPGLLACDNDPSHSTAAAQTAADKESKKDVDQGWKKLPGEQKLDTWTILYEPPNGGKYNGKLLVTNKRLLYDAKFDYSTRGMLEELAFIKWESEGYLEIDKENIIAVETQKLIFAQKCILTLKDGSRHSFNYGAMNIDKCAAAIRSK